MEGGRPNRNSIVVLSNSELGEENKQDEPPRLRDAKERKMT